MPCSQPQETLSRSLGKPILVISPPRAAQSLVASRHRFCTISQVWCISRMVSDTAPGTSRVQTYPALWFCPQAGSLGPTEERCCRYLPPTRLLSHFSHVWLFVIPGTVACQAPQSTGFSRQEYWSGLLCPPPGELPDPGIEPASSVSSVLKVGSLPTEPPGKTSREHQLPGCTFPFWNSLPSAKALQSPGGVQRFGD